MSRIAYVNGVYLPHPDARVSIDDRGFLFGDAIYEVWGVIDGALRDREGHFARLARSLRELEITPPMGMAALERVIRETIRRNRLRFGYVYLQISRGAAPRDHAFPAPPVRPTLVVTAKRLDRKAYEARAAAGVSVITAPDIRWGRCDIKTVNLLPNALAKEAAKRAGAAEVWLVDEAGFVTEGASSNAWIVDAHGVLRTRALDHAILHGVTRARVLELATALQMRMDETPFTPQEAAAAREAFLTSATNGPVPIVRLDGTPIGDGRPGPVTLRLRDAYFGAA
ncbi:MAG: D-amino-acid transaminase [Alphaproteobacteria bacterium]|nr:D-amino-acid transaminase [Alphaproteobacteria bacterium]